MWDEPGSQGCPSPFFKTVCTGTYVQKTIKYCWLLLAARVLMCPKMWVEILSPAYIVHSLGVHLLLVEVGRPAVNAPGDQASDVAFR